MTPEGAHLEATSDVLPNLHHSAGRSDPPDIENLDNFAKLQIVVTRATQNCPKT